MAGGLNPSDLTVLNNEVLFNSNGHIGLWVTNGTTAGTYELTNISVADSGGLTDWTRPATTAFG